MADEERVRVDAWLWAVRVHRTRTAAKDACVGGKVRIGTSVAKPASKVAVGDEVFVRRGDHLLHLRVERTLTKRVGAALVVEYATDLDPQPLGPRTRDADTFEPLAAIRDRGAGRPTKRDRRRLDQLRKR